MIGSLGRKKSGTTFITRGYEICDEAFMNKRFNNRTQIEAAKRHKKKIKHCMAAKPKEKDPEEK